MYLNINPNSFWLMSTKATLTFGWTPSILNNFSYLATLLYKNPIFKNWVLVTIKIVGFFLKIDGIFWCFWLSLWEKFVKSYYNKKRTNFFKGEVRSIQKFYSSWIRNLQFLFVQAPMTGMEDLKTKSNKFLRKKVADFKHLWLFPNQV